MTDGVTQEMVRARFLYNKEFGRLIWLSRPLSDFGGKNQWSIWNSRYAGCFAGSVGTKGYRSINVFGKMRKASRLTWVYHFGQWPDVIDHIDGDTANDRLENIRSVTQAENCLNRKLVSRNTTGVPGVYRDGNGFCAQIGFSNKKFFLGRFGNVNDAIAARHAAEQKFGFHPNNGRAA